MSASASGSGSTPPSRPGTRPKKPQLTHFLCLPLHNAASQLTHSLAALQTDLVTNLELVSTSAIRPAVTMHLTLGVMSLPTPADIQRAKDFVESGVDFAQMLQELDPAGEVVVDLRGLEAMGERRRTSVLYAVPVDATGRLKAFAEKVRGVFVEEGFVVDEGRELKLHATVVNTIYSKGRRGGGGGWRGRGRGGGGGGGGRGDQKETFDAEMVVGRYRDVAFAEGVRLDRVAVCRMSEVKGEDGASEGYLVVGERLL